MALLRALTWWMCRAGGNDFRQQIPVGPGYQVAMAERVRRESRRGLQVRSG